MKQYLDLLTDVMVNGERRGDRTGTGTISVFGRQLRFNLQDGFPLVTTKKMFVKGFIHEMLWFLSGDTNIKYLNDNGVHIWDEWASPTGELGPVYGRQWRMWYDGKRDQCIDQIAEVITSIKTNPMSRRHIVTAWNPVDIPDMSLPPCHMMFQFYVSTGGKLSCHLYIRSNDLFLGAPFNIAQYALLTHMVADQTNLEVGDLVYTIGDAHIYMDHLEQVEEQYKREPYPLPELLITRRPESIFDYRFEDFTIVNYQHHPAIKGEVSV